MYLQMKMFSIFRKGKFKIAVFISGKGSNLESLIRNSNKIYDVKLVVSNKKDANGLNIAKKYGIKTLVSNKESDYYNYSKEVDLICLAGFMMILSKDFIRKSPPIVNIHPSLLPKYKGLKVHERVLKAGDKETGCTVHVVTKKVDSGKIIKQRKVKVLENDTVDTLKERVHYQEHKLYPQAVKEIALTIKSVK